jgi:hypothetical protein
MVVMLEASTDLHRIDFKNHLSIFPLSLFPSICRRFSTVLATTELTEDATDSTLPGRLGQSYSKHGSSDYASTYGPNSQQFIFPGHVSVLSERLPYFGGCFRRGNKYVTWRLRSSSMDLYYANSN